MGAYDSWCAQKPKLLQALKDTESQSGVVSAVRHALAQAEQSVMAEQPDDLLRQQIGILFHCCKTSVSLLDVSMTAKVWETQSVQKEKKGKSALFFWVIAGLVQLAGILYGYARGQLISWLLMAAALVIAVIALWNARTKNRNASEAQGDHLKVTLRVDADKLLQVLDVQMRAIDRYGNDFTYLNEQAAGKGSSPDDKTAALMADMLEALYECDEDSREAAEEAADKMLEGLGLAAVSYSPDTKGLFTILPSKDETRTMIPAIVASGDHHLLRRGVAAVHMAETAS